MGYGEKTYIRPDIEMDMDTARRKPIPTNQPYLQKNDNHSLLHFTFLSVCQDVLTVYLAGVSLSISLPSTYLSVYLLLSLSLAR